ncbi:YbaY family lipoprotein [Streptomyces cucumeris]|uniref:YbaY family lipoprotein n=1 Tax=Streptomyces TaxID=1883 RepID=UPI0020C93816|nr:YbaY family lipoprotein [Streptomyces sp. NEAU-Y11]MCP9212954.1 YbaY family lipoprotein [Streptomyces sp. NEAU-Y11]
MREKPSFPHGEVSDERRPGMSSVLSGIVSLPADAPAGQAARVVVEVRNVSRADMPSSVVGAQVLTDVPLSPGGHVPFSVKVPGELVPGDAYGLRVHIDVSGTGFLERGDLVSAHANPVPAGSVAGLIAPVSKV